MEPLYSEQHWEPTFVPYSEVSLTQASGTFPVGVILHNSENFAQVSTIVSIQWGVQKVSFMLNS